MEDIEVTAEKMVFEGKALARHARYVVFLDGALPGEKVRARVTKKKRRFAFATVTEILEPSPLRREPPCPLFGTCGGCAFQHADYPAQLRFKREIVLDAFHDRPDAGEKTREVIGAGAAFYFRNKMTFAFGREDGAAVIGLHRRGDWRHVVATENCLLQSPESCEVLRRTLAWVRENDIPVFDEEARAGLLRHLIIREGKHTGDRMAHLHASDPHPAIERLPAALEGLCTTVLVSYHTTVPEAAPPEQTYTLAGPGFIRDRLNEFTFEIGPTTFFQTNTLQAERMFQLVRTWASEARPKTVVDLYAGTGPIAMHLGAAAERVVGIESNPASVAMAERNIHAHGLKNVEMVCAEVQKTGPGVFPKPADLVVVDPPRAGLHKKAVEVIVAARPRSLIYVSCNPVTLARDLALLAEGGYALEVLQPFDLFPHSYHVETVAKLGAS